MSDKIQATVAGNLTADPVLRATPNGNMVAHFTVASTPRTYNQASKQWEDGEPNFMRCQVWRDQAENVAESLHKGDRVVVSGTLQQRSYVDQDNQKQTVWELHAEDVAASMKFARVQVNRQRQNQGQNQQAGDGIDEFKPNGGEARKPATGRKQTMQASA
ncbi:single-stranded DNA-binding protein [Nocardia sp. NPDC101769]|uniref:single-stranded DNA-binding protein n=1 Tax=Nocardia sp. NPDC101769 TaxID=3364333 RepID=UPI003829888A